MRARGLKHSGIEGTLGFKIVAPHAGAWIETIPDTVECGDIPVAPHAGAWIETDSGRFISPEKPSRLMRARGLKQHIPPLFRGGILSRLMRARGLKPL